MTCDNRKKPGGCPLHNLQCGYPECDEPTAPELPALPQSLFRFNIAPHAASGGSMVAGYTADQMRAYALAYGESLRAKNERLRADAEQLRLSLTFIVDRDLTYFDGYVDRHCISMGAIEQARRVLLATGPVAASDAAMKGTPG